MKKRWMARRQKEGKPIDKPNLVRAALVSRQYGHTRPASDRRPDSIRSAVTETPKLQTGPQGPRHCLSEPCNIDCDSSSWRWRLPRCAPAAWSCRRACSARSPACLQLRDPTSWVSPGQLGEHGGTLRRSWATTSRSAGVRSSPLQRAQQPPPCTAMIHGCPPCRAACSARHACLLRLLLSTPAEPGLPRPARWTCCIRAELLDPDIAMHALGAANAERGRRAQRSSRATLRWRSVSSTWPRTAT